MDSQEEKQAKGMTGWMQGLTGLRTGVLPFLPYLALFAQGLSASYGVYQFALLFVPEWVARANAIAFELTYIGLSGVPIHDSEGKKKAVWVARGAAAVSICYNVISGYLHRNPTGVFHIGEAVLAVLRGTPFALTAYVLSEVLLHGQATSQGVKAGDTGMQDIRETGEVDDKEGDSPDIKIESPMQAALPDLASLPVSEKRTRAKEMADEGKGHQEIATLLGVSRTRVGQYIKEMHHG